VKGKQILIVAVVALATVVAFDQFKNRRPGQ
jgi:hypothetical protein